jgi:predicted transglutaminase-like cysteine proteinase
LKVAALERAALPPQRSPVGVTEASGEPFGLATARAPEGDIRIKWWSVEAGMRLDLESVRGCRAEPDSCSRAALAFIAIVDAARAREGRARIGEINRAVNLAIRPVSDTAQHGLPDFWSAPLATLASGRGDCEDYAIAKYAALREIGFDERDLRLLVVRTNPSEVHAVVSMRFEGRWLILDNRSLTIVEDRDLRARPLFVLGGAKVAIFATHPAFGLLAAKTPPATAAAALPDREVASAGGLNAAPLLM